MVLMETPSASAKTFMRDKILHIMRKLSSINLVERKLSLTFAAYSVMNERPKIRKNREFSKFTDMSETKKMTTEVILEIFKGEYNRLLRKYERRVEKYALNMNEDFEHFFRWYADDMYKAQVNLKAIRELRPMTSWTDLDKIKMWLGNHIKNIEGILIEGSQYPTSSSIMHNVADTLRRISLQELREEIQVLLMAITCNE